MYTFTLASGLEAECAKYRRRGVLLTNRRLMKDGEGVNSVATVWSGSETGRTRAKDVLDLCPATGCSSS
jgi:hypothetical protein